MPEKSAQLSQEFKTLVDKMRAKKSVKGALSLFTATPEELGKSASTAAKRKTQKH